MTKSEIVVFTVLFVLSGFLLAVQSGCLKAPETAESPAITNTGGVIASDSEAELLKKVNPVLGSKSAANYDRNDIFAAIDKSDIAAVRILMKRSPLLVHSKAEHNYSTLHKAVSGSSFISSGLLPGQKGFEELPNDTALRGTLYDNAYKINEFLISSGANVNARADDGMTPLHIAVCWCDLQTIKLLVSKGADVDAKDNRGITPYKMAVLLRESKIADLLRKFRNDEVEDIYDAAERGNLKKVKSFLNKDTLHHLHTSNFCTINGRINHFFINLLRRRSFSCMSFRYSGSSTSP